MSQTIIVPEGIEFDWSPQECEYCGQPWHADSGGRCSSCSANPPTRPIIITIKPDLTCEEIEDLKRTVNRKI